MVYAHGIPTFFEKENKEKLLEKKLISNTRTDSRTMNKITVQRVNEIGELLDEFTKKKLNNLVIQRDKVKMESQTIFALCHRCECWPEQKKN